MIDISSGGSGLGDDSAPGEGGVRAPTRAAASPVPEAEIPVPVRLTEHLPGTGGRLKDEPEDFVVDEVPLYEPSGHGDHIYLLIEKRDLSHERMVEHIGRALNVSRHDIGTAGMKDRRAVTRQWVSAPARCEPHIKEIENEFVRVLDATKHTNSLKTGHCRGNKFNIVIRGVGAEAQERATRIFDALSPYGCPNYYGSQRFGADGQTLLTGYKLVAGLMKPSAISKPRRKFLVRLGLSALQSAIFNDLLAGRVEANLFREVMEGDVMTFPGSRALFKATDPTAEQHRLDAGETLITGPMIGVKMKGPVGRPAELEAAAVAKRNLRVGQFAAWKNAAPGGRRPLAVRPDVELIEQMDDAIRVVMTLPTGSFATVVLDEVMKVAV